MDGNSDYGLQIKVWYAASVFDSMQRSRLVAKAGGVLGVKPPFPKFSTCKQFHRIYFGEKSEIREHSITKLIHENKHSYDCQRARTSNDILRNRFTGTQCNIMPVTAEVWVRSLESFSASHFWETFGLQQLRSFH